jgi:hypothetical protein
MNNNKIEKESISNVSCFMNELNAIIMLQLFGYCGITTIRIVEEETLVLKCSTKTYTYKILKFCSDILVNINATVHINGMCHHICHSCIAFNVSHIPCTSISENNKPCRIIFRYNYCEFIRFMTRVSVSPKQYRKSRIYFITHKQGQRQKRRMTQNTFYRFQA